MTEPEDPGLPAAAEDDNAGSTRRWRRAVSTALAGAAGSAPNAPAVELWRDTDIEWQPRPHKP